MALPRAGAVSRAGSRASPGPRPGTRRSALVATLAFGVLTSLAAPLSAQPAASHVAAGELFDAGVAARDRGDWPTAYQSFLRSQKLEPAPGTLLNLALCEEKLGKVSSAADHLTQVIEGLLSSDD